MEKKSEEKVVYVNVPAQNNPLQLVLIVLLVVGSYLLGSVMTKVQILEKVGGLAAAGGKQAVAGADTGTGQQAGAPPAQAAPALEAPNVPKVDKTDWIKGDSKARIALIEYSDLECPFCKTFHPTAQQLVDKYDGKVMWIWRHYPLSFHQNAQKEAEASECAAEQGGNDAFWKYADTVMQRTTSNGTGFALTALVPLAKELGLDGAKFQDCLDTGRMAQKVKDQQDGGTKAGVTGTPGNIILDTKTGKTRLIPGALPYDNFKTVIDEMLK